MMKLGVEKPISVKTWVPRSKRLFFFTAHLMPSGMVTPRTQISEMRPMSMELRIAGPTTLTTGALCW